MAFIKGREAVRERILGLPARLEPIFRGAARSGGKVFAEYVEQNTPSEAVRADLRIRTKADAGTVKATVDIKPGWGRTVGNWLEWGTSAHFISVDDSQRGGRSVARINQQVAAEGGNSSLVIGGKFVGATVWHPGARPHPVFRPARDLKEAEAIAAAQGYINARLAKGDFSAAEGDAE